MRLRSLRRQVAAGAIAGLLALPLGISSAPAFAESEEMIEEVVVTGVRGKPRTVRESPVPVDVFTSEVMDDVAFTDMNDIMRTLVPSYGLSRQPISDGATFIRPAKMRGLPTDKTLVLVNGKRRHRAALVLIGGSGSQGPDLATIPGAAVESVEVVRDGATALYGSDAIAGVINFMLKDDSEGGSITMTTGEYYAGDGQDMTISGNLGFGLGSDGFLTYQASSTLLTRPIVVSSIADLGSVWIRRAMHTIHLSPRATPPELRMLLIPISSKPQKVPPYSETWYNLGASPT